MDKRTNASAPSLAETSQAEIHPLSPRPCGTASAFGKASGKLSSRPTWHDPAKMGYLPEAGFLMLIANALARYNDHSIKARDFRSERGRLQSLVGAPQDIKAGTS